MLTSLPGGVVGFLIVVNILVFFLAFFLDFFEIAFIIIPLLAPVAQKLGIDLVWFGVLLGVNMQTSFMHPPFGFALFYLRGIAPPAVKSSDIYWGAIPWVGLQLVMCAIVIVFPGVVTSFLPGTSSASPSTIEQEDAGPRARRRRAGADRYQLSESHRPRHCESGNEGPSRAMGGERLRSVHPRPGWRRFKREMS